MTIPTAQFTMPEVAALTGVNLKTLHSWIKNGWLRASIKSSAGHGVEILLSPQDVLAFGVAAALRRAGADMGTARRAATFLADRTMSEVAAEAQENPYLLVNREHAWLLDDDKLHHVLREVPDTPRAFSIYHVGQALASVKRLVEQKQRAAKSGGRTRQLAAS